LCIELKPVLLAGDLAGGVVVVYRNPAIELVVLRIWPAIAATQFGGNVLVAVFVDQLRQQRTVEVFRVHVFEPGLAAPLPMLDQIGEQLTRPAGATFEEAKAQIGETPRHAAEKQGLGYRMPGGGEVTDVVEGEVTGRIAQTHAAASG